MPTEVVGLGLGLVTGGAWVFGLAGVVVLGGVFTFFDEVVYYFTLFISLLLTKNSLE